MPEVKGSIPDTVKRLFRSTALEHKLIVVLATQRCDWMLWNGTVSPQLTTVEVLKEH